MKNFKLLATALMMIFSIASQAQEPTKYYKAMQKAVAKLDTTTQVSSYFDLQNTFERIATAEKKEWLPYYYAAYCAMRIAYRQENNNRIDVKADIAQALLDKADSLSPKNSEIYCVKAMILYSRISVDVMSRGPKYSVMGGKIVEEAIAIDMTNPRPFILIGDGKFSLPPQFGGDKKMACQLFNKAKGLMEIPPKDDISPRWGGRTVERMLKKCEELNPAVSSKSQP